MGVVAAAETAAEFNPMLATGKKFNYVAPAASFPKADRFKDKPKEALGFTNTIGLS